MPKTSKRVVRKVVSKKPPAASPAVMDRVRRITLWLGCLFPVDYPIRVVWTDRMLSDRLGECGFNKKTMSFEIRLRRRLNTEMALSTLAHEWAHALTMMGMREGEDFHSDRFWLVLGEIDRAWQGGGQRAAARLSL